MIKYFISLFFVTSCFAVGNGPYPNGGSGGSGSNTNGGSGTFFLTGINLISTNTLLTSPITVTTNYIAWETQGTNVIENLPSTASLGTNEPVLLFNSTTNNGSQIITPNGSQKVLGLTSFTNTGITGLAIWFDGVNWQPWGGGGTGVSGIIITNSIISVTNTTPTAYLGVDANSNVVKTAIISIGGITNADFLAQSAAKVIAVYTTLAGVTNKFEVGGYINVTAVTVDVAAFQVVFTDENGTSRTVASLSGVAATGFSAAPTITIRALPSTTVTIQAALTTGTGSITYDTGGFIRGVY